MQEDNNIFIPKNFCSCGCWEEIPLLESNGHNPLRFKTGHCATWREKHNDYDLWKGKKFFIGRLIPVHRCACGCGEYIRFNRRIKRGHLGRPSIVYPIIKCACGCGGEFPEKAGGKGYSKRIYLVGHYRNGKINSPETRQKIKKDWHRYHPIHPLLGKHRTPETKRKLSEYRKNQTFPLEDTKIEILVRDELSRNSIGFEKHRVFKIRDTYHPVDVFIEPNICIECDGDYWHGRLIAIRRDLIVNYELERQGMIVIRLWEYDINNNLEWCMNLIKSSIK